MKSFLAIVKLTLRNAMRSHIFQLLLLLLLLAVVLIPSTISAGENAGDFIRISLLYSLSAVSFILTLSSIWLGCHAMTHDVDNYQLHMVVTKPVSRVQIWLAKCFGVYLIHLVLLFAAGTAIYFIILYKFNSQDFSAQERERIQNEVMVGRRVYLPEKTNYDEAARRLLGEKIQRLNARGQVVDTSAAAQEAMYKESRREAVIMETELPYGGRRDFRFANIPHDLQKPLFLRYRVYIGKIATEGQRMTRSFWAVGVVRTPQQQKAAANVFEQQKQTGYEVYLTPLAEYPEQVMSGEFHEKVLRPEWKIISPADEVMLSYGNFDDSGEKQYFQPADGPKLLIEVCGFFQNYLRAVAVIALALLIFCGLGCTLGGLQTLPTAIFCSVSYLLVGSLALYMVNLSYVAGAADHVGQFIAKTVLMVVIPLQAFEVTGHVANGEIVEFSLLWALFLNYFIFRALPLFALGILLYRRRELGLVIRK